MAKEIISQQLKIVENSYETISIIDDIIEKLKTGEILGVTFSTDKEEFNLELNKLDSKEWISYLKAYKFHKKTLGKSSAKSAELLITNL